MKEFMNEEHISFEKVPKAAQELILDVLYGRVQGCILQQRCKVDEKPVWTDKTSKNLFHASVYRVTYKKVKPSVNWDHVNEQYNYLAIDSDKVAYLYTHKPIFDHGIWCYDNGYYSPASAHSSLDIGDCAPEGSLICRPGFE